MPKRRNPFGDDSPLQFKSHIGKKEVDTGVCMDENMRDVFERTKQLLFQGRQHAKSPAKHQPEPSSPVEELRPIPGQMRLDTTGHLCNNNNNNNNLPESLNMQQHSGFTFNKACERGEEMDTDSGTPLPTGQLQIDSTGHLCAGLKVAAQTVASGHKLCNSCHRPSMHQMRACNFCDRNTCGGCLRDCCSCHGRFCQLCSTLNYDDCMEQAYCLQCAP